MARKDVNKHAEYEPPMQTFTPCPNCGSTICVRLWQMTEGQRTGQWVSLAKPISPVYGEEHVCTGGSGAPPATGAPTTTAPLSR